MAVTPLVTYGSDVASGTLATAGTLATGTGGVSSSIASLVSTAGTAWGQLYGLGNASAWPNLGAIGAPDGHGFLLDATTLEGKQILAGNWTPVYRLATSVGTATADVVIRAYKRSSGGAYTLINSWTSAAQALTTGVLTVSPTAANPGAVSFATGDKLYIDVWANITTNGITAGGTLKLSVSSSALGIATDVQVTTPGYATITNKAGRGRSIVTASSYVSTVLADTPQGYYRLDEASGLVAFDRSGVAGNGTITASGVSYSQPGALVGDPDTAMAFTSSSGKVTLPTALDANGWTGMTVECWIIPTTTGPANASAYNIAVGPSSNGLHTGYIIYLFGTASLPQMIFQCGNGTVNPAAQANNLTLVAGTAYHIVGTYDGSVNRLYINGVLKATSTAITGAISNAAGIPTISTPTASFFPGTIDDYAIYNFALTQAQITKHYTAGAGTTKAGTGRTRFASQVSRLGVGRSRLASLHPAPLGQDTFTRTAVGSGWGIGTDGQPWTIKSGSAANVSTNGTKGSAVTAPTFFWYGSNQAQDTEILARFSLGNTGDNVLLMSRYVDINNYYCTLVQDTTIRFRILRAAAQTDYLTTTVAAASGALFWVRFRVQGQTLYMRRWLDGNAEPTTWAITQTVADAPTSSNYGIRMTPTTAAADTIDTFSATPLQASATGRVRLAGQTSKIGMGRIRFFPQVSRFGSGRTRLASQTNQAGRGRVRLVSPSTKSGAGRARITFAASRSASGRVRLASAVSRLGTGRTKIAAAATSVSRSGAGRTRLASVVSRNYSGRARLTAQTSKMGTGRAVVRGQTSRSGMGRIRFFPQVSRAGVGRVRTVVASVKSATGRLKSVVQTARASVGRTRLASQTSRNATGRARLSSQIVRSAVGRIRFFPQTLRSGSGRTRVIAQTLRSAVGRVRVQIGGLTFRFGVGRVRLASLAARSAVGRVRYGVQTRKSGMGRVILRGRTALASMGRVRLASLVRRSGAGRARIASLISRSGKGRANYVSQTRKSSTGRLVFFGQTRNVGKGRTRLASLVVRSGRGRAGLAGQTSKSSTGRAIVRGSAVRRAVGRAIVRGRTQRGAVGRLTLITLGLVQLSGRGRARLVAGGRKTATGRVGIVTVPLSHITVTAAGGFVTSEGARGTIETSGARGSIAVEGASGTMTSEGPAGFLTVEQTP